MKPSPNTAIWTTESNKSSSWLYGIAGVIVGGLFIYGWRTLALEPTTGIAVLGLGLLCGLLGLATLISGTSQVITVDPGRRMIDIKTTTRFGTKKRIIPFNHIIDTAIGEVGTREGGSVRYHVKLTLKDRSECALFAGFYDDSYDHQAMESRRLRIDGYLRQYRQHLG
jgi:hypothetical protein